MHPNGPSRRRIFLRQILIKFCSGKRSLLLVWILTFCVSYVVLSMLPVKDVLRQMRKRPATLGVGPPVLRAQECTEQGLKDWVANSGATMIDLAYEDFQNEGLPWNGPPRRGVMTLKDLKENDEIMRVPINLALSPLHVNKTDLKAIALAHPEWDSFFVAALMVLYESMKPDSFWWRWLCMLPRELSSPIFWSQERTSKLDDFSVVKVEQSRAMLRHYYTETMVPLLKEHPQLFPKSEFTASRFMWACGIVMSRAWGYPADLNDTSAGFTHLLMPFADMFNHANYANGVSFHNVPGYLTLATAVDVKRGGELFLNYGPKCNLRLLITYGFELAKNEIEKCKDELTPPVIFKTSDDIKVYAPVSMSSRSKLQVIIEPLFPVEDQSKRQFGCHMSGVAMISSHAHSLSKKQMSCELPIADAGTYHLTVFESWNGKKYVGQVLFEQEVTVLESADSQHALALSDLPDCVGSSEGRWVQTTFAVTSLNATSSNAILNPKVEEEWAALSSSMPLSSFKSEEERTNAIQAKLSQQWVWLPINCKNKWIEPSAMAVQQLESINLWGGTYSHDILVALQSWLQGSALPQAQGTLKASDQELQAKVDDAHSVSLRLGWALCGQNNAALLQKWVTKAKVCEKSGNFVGISCLCESSPGDTTDLTNDCESLVKAAVEENSCKSNSTFMMIPLETHDNDDGTGQLYQQVGKKYLSSIQIYEIAVQYGLQIIDIAELAFSLSVEKSNGDRFNEFITSTALQLILNMITKIAE